MLTPEDTLLIGGFAGLMLGYAIGFAVARLIYKGQPR